MAALSCSPSEPYMSLRNLPKRDELWLRSVCAFPNDSRTGDERRTRSVRPERVPSAGAAAAAPNMRVEKEVVWTELTAAR